MSVHYKFKSSLDFDTVTFDGLHISVTDLKKSIMQQKKIGKSADFDLQITNAQTKEVYDDEEALIPKNTSVIVARVPITNPGKKIWERGDIQVPSQEIDPGSHIRYDKLAKTADLANAVASEEEKIKAMMTQSSQEYDVSKYVKSRSMTGPLPANYTCYRCGKPGHWIKNCPTNNLEIKRSTGIPRSFMVPVDGPEHKGALLTSTGDFAVPLIDHQAYKEVKKEKPPFLKEPEPQPDPEPKIPEDLLCMLCKDLLQDAVLIPCCGNSFCDECIRTYLLESENHECPECHETDVSPDTLIPNRFQRNGVMKFKKESGYITVKSLHQPLNEIHHSSTRASTPTQLPVPDAATISTSATTNTVSTTAVINTANTAAVINTTCAASSTVTAISSTNVVAVDTAKSATTITTSATATTLTASITAIATDTTSSAVTALNSIADSTTITTTTATTTITTSVISTITPSTATSSVDCHTAVSSVAESTNTTSSIQTVTAPVIIVSTAASTTSTASILHSPYSSPAVSPASICNSGSAIVLPAALPVSTPPSSPCRILKESVNQNDKVEELEKRPTCQDIVAKSEDFNCSEEIAENHATESTNLEIELDDNQPGTPLADEPPVDLEADIPLESKLPVDALQSSIGSPYESAIPLDPHNDNSMSPTREGLSGNSIATITTRGPPYMLSGLGFGRSQQNSRQYSSRSNAPHESSYGSSRASRSSRSGYGTPPRERYRQGRRSEHSNYKSSYGGYGSQSSSHHMGRNYQGGASVASTTLSSHGSQSRYGNQVQSHRVNIPPGYMTQNIQRPHAPLPGLQPSYPVQPPPAKHFERGEETGRGILPLPHRVPNDAPYKRKLNSSPLEIHGQATIASQPPPPGVAPVLLSTPQTHGSLFPYQHEEFYHDSRRMKDRNTMGDPLDDFARQLMEYSREQQRRPSSRHCSRSRSSSASHSYNSLKSSGWSHSGSHSDSHSSSRSRSRSFSSRSRSPSYRRSRSRSRSRSFSRSSRSRSRSVSRSRSRSRGRNSSPRKRSNSKSNSPKNFIRYMPRSPYHQKKDYSATFFNPSYHPPYASTVPHPAIPLDHFQERNRYYRDQYRPYDEYHNTYNSPRYEQHDQRYDPKYIQDYQRFDTTQHRPRTREPEKYERGRNRDVSRRRETVSKPVSEKPRETEVKDGGTEGHSKTKKKEEKPKHRKHHHKNKDGKKEAKQEEHKKKELLDIVEKTDISSSQTKKSEVIDPNKKNVVHDNKEKKHKHKRRKENDEVKKKKKSRELTRTIGEVSEKPIKSKKKKAKKEIGKTKLDKLQIPETIPDKPIEDSPRVEACEVTEQSPNETEMNIATEEVGLEEDAVNVSNPNLVLEEPVNEATTPCVSNDEQPVEGENPDSPKEVLEEDTEIKKEDYEELEQPSAVDAEEEVDNFNPEMTDDGEVVAEKVDSDEGVVHSDDANIPEISFELPEISKWEREEFEAEDGSSNSDSGNLQEMKASLPSDIIQRAEKAILQKPLKDAIIGPPTSRDKHRSLEKKISEKPLRSGDASRDSVVVVVNVKEKENKSKEQGIEKEINTKDKPEEDSLQITISAEKNKRSVQTKSKSVKREKSIDLSQNKKLKLDRSKFSEQLKGESLVSYADSSDNVATEKLYSSDSSKEFSSKSETTSRKKENIVITKKEKERKCNIEPEIEKSKGEESSKRVRRSTKRSPSSRAKQISSSSPYQKHEISGDYSETKNPSKLEPYDEHDSDKRMSHGRRYRTEGKTKRRETGHDVKEEKVSSAHNREFYRESEQHNTTKLIKRRERSRSRSYDSNQSLGKTQRSRSQIKLEDRKRTKRRTPTHNSSSERKRLCQETELFSSRTDPSQMNFENRMMKESFLMARSRKESTQDEANFEPNYDETSDSDNSSEAEDSKRRSKHHSERRTKKFEPIETVPKIGEPEFENMRVQDSIIRAECSNERTLKRRDRSNSSVSSSDSSQTGSVSISSGTERSSRKRLRSNSAESDTKHKHRKSKHKKHKKHRHKHKRKKSHKYKQR